MNAILLTCEANYGDEFDCQQLAIVFGASMQQVQEALKKACSREEDLEEGEEPAQQPSWRRDYGPEMYFGTNEFLDGDTVLETTEMKEITVAEAEQLMKLLGITRNKVDNQYELYNFGTGVLTHIEDHLPEEQE
jgi:hypothetical protein